MGWIFRFMLIRLCGCVLMVLVSLVMVLVVGEFGWVMMIGLLLLLLLCSLMLSGIWLSNGIVVFRCFDSVLVVFWLLLVLNSLMWKVLWDFGVVIFSYDMFFMMFNICCCMILVIVLVCLVILDVVCCGVVMISILVLGSFCFRFMVMLLVLGGRLMRR